MIEHSQISRLNGVTSKLITSTQVVTSVSTAVKELIENSLDANARNVEVRLENYGLTLIEVKDDGCGIKCTDIPKVGKQGHTSKIRSFTCIADVDTYGFRGEALSSLCRLSEISITTRAEGDKLGMTYVLESNGQIKSSQPSHITKGTIISISKLFSNVPVRRNYLQHGKKPAEELKKVEHVVKCMAIINPQLRISLKHNKCLIWQKNAVTDIRPSFMQVVGLKVVSKMVHIKESENKVELDLIIPKKGIEDTENLFVTMSDQLFVFINKRYVLHKEIRRVVMKHISIHFKHLDLTNKTAIALVKLKVPGGDVDVNIEPNKNRVLIEKEMNLLLFLEKILAQYYGHELDVVIDQEPRKETESDVDIDLDISIPKKRFREDLTNTANESNDQTGDTEVETNHEEGSFRSTQDILNLMDKPQTNICSQINTKNNVLSVNEVHTLNEVFNEKHKLIKSISDRAFEIKLDNDIQSQKVSLGCKETNSTSNMDGLSCNNLKKNDIGSLEENRLSDESLNTEFNLVTETNNSNNSVADSKLAWSKGHVSVNGKQIVSTTVLLQPKTSKDEDLDMSLQSVSSQMGKKQFSAFTKFARDMRPKIVQENPGILFTKVSDLLAEKWQELPEDEKDKYKQLAVELDEKRIQKRDIKTLQTSKLTVTKKTNNKSDQDIKTVFEKTKKPPKPSRKQVIINVSLDEIKTFKKKETQTAKELEILGQLKPSGHWIYLQDNKIGHIRYSGLQELVIYHRMLNMHSVPTTPLERKIHLDLSMFRRVENVWNVLFSLDTEVDITGNHFVIHHVISKNGFRIQICKGEHEHANYAIITDIASTIPSYGVHELIETLQLYISEGDSAGLAAWRNKAVINYIKGEAVRITSQSAPSAARQNLDELLQTWRIGLQHLPAVCLHSKAIFEPLYTLKQNPECK